jgi:hypothetical protein
VTILSQLLDNVDQQRNEVSTHILMTQLRQRFQLSVRTFTHGGCSKGLCNLFDGDRSVQGLIFCRTMVVQEPMQGFTESRFNRRMISINLFNTVVLAFSVRRTIQHRTIPYLPCPQMKVQRWMINYFLTEGITDQRVDCQGAKKERMSFSQMYPTHAMALGSISTHRGVYLEVTSKVCSGICVVAIWKKEEVTRNVKVMAS